MKVGDLVRPTMSCGGQLGGIRCDSALVLNKRQIWKSVEVDAYVYEEVEVHEYDLICSCGQFDEDGNFLEIISESR